jgi:hypothetical protein
MVLGDAAEFRHRSGWDRVRAFAQKQRDAAELRTLVEAHIAAGGAYVVLPATLLHRCPHEPVRSFNQSAHFYTDLLDFPTDGEQDLPHGA